MSLIKRAWRKLFGKKPKCVTFEVTPDCQNTVVKTFRFYIDGNEIAFDPAPYDPMWKNPGYLSQYDEYHLYGKRTINEVRDQDLQKLLKNAVKKGVPGDFIGDFIDDILDEINRRNGHHS